MMEDYPDNYRLLKERLDQLIFAKSYHKKSPRKWDKGQLYSLHALVKEVLFADHQPELYARGKSQLCNTPELLNAMKCITGRDHRLPLFYLQQHLNDQGASCAFAFYFTLQDIFRRHPEYDPETYCVSSEEGPYRTGVTHTSDTDLERHNDEVVTTRMAISFISLVSAFQIQGQEEGTAGDVSRSSDVERACYLVNTMHGFYRTRTDGIIYEITFDGERCWRLHEGMSLIDIEAKAATKNPKAQHIAEVIGHMHRRLCYLFRQKEFQSYHELEGFRRIVFLLCFRPEGQFYVVWAEFNPEYLEWLFGPIGEFEKLSTGAMRDRMRDNKRSNHVREQKEDKDDETEGDNDNDDEDDDDKEDLDKQDIVPHQTFYISESASYMSPSGREKISEILLGLLSIRNPYELL